MLFKMARCIYGMLFCVVACSILPTPSGTVSKYILTPPLLPCTKTEDKRIVVLTPTLSVALQDHNRIVYQPTPQKIEYLAGGEWAQKLDTMIGENLLDALRTSHKFKYVVSDASAIPEGDYSIVKTHICTLGVVHQNNQRVVQAIYEITCVNKDGNVTLQKRLQHIIPLNTSSLDDIISAMNDAHHCIVKQINKML